MGVHVDSLEGRVPEVPTDPVSLCIPAYGTAPGPCRAPRAALHASNPPRARPRPLGGQTPGHLAPAPAALLQPPASPASQRAHCLLPPPGRRISPCRGAIASLRQPPRTCLTAATWSRRCRRRHPALTPIALSARETDSGAGFLFLFLPSTSRKMTLRQRRRNKARPQGPPLLTWD